MPARSTKVALLFITAAVCIGGFVSFGGLGNLVYKCGGNNDLVNPRRKCADPVVQKEYDQLKLDLEKKIGAWEAANSATHVSVYFRDLYNGPTFGINEHELFIPASLSKVPIMMAVLRAAQEAPAFLNEKVYYDGSMTDLQNIKDPRKTLHPHEEYTIDQLLQYMIAHSDNVCAQLLKLQLEVMAPGYLGRIFGDLGIVPQYKDGEEYLSVKNYASVFRMLYNSSFLDTERSEHALQLLAKVDFEHGIVAGVPDGTVVAHKYGVYKNADGNETQLHDCGIVYHPYTDYILCVMTRSPSIDNGAKMISEISNKVFEEVSAREKESQ